MLNKSHPLSRHKSNNGKNKKKNVWCILTLIPGSLSLATDSNLYLIESQLYFGLIDCMILINEYVSLTTAAMKLGKRHFYSDHSNGC